MEQKATTPAMHAIGRVIIGDSLLLLMTMMMTMLSYTRQEAAAIATSNYGNKQGSFGWGTGLNMTWHAAADFSPRLASAVEVKKKLCKSEE